MRIKMTENWWSGLPTTLASFMFAWTMVRQFIPYQLHHPIEKLTTKLFGYCNPYIEITFHEYNNTGFKRSEAYTTIQTYLAATASKQAKKLKGEMGRDSASIVMSMDDYEKVKDEFRGVKLWWSSHKRSPRSQTISFYPALEEQRYYRLIFHRHHRQLVIDNYLPHVVEEGKAIGLKKRQRKLYTNNPSSKWCGKKDMWSHVVFGHPATFDMLAMEPEKKKEIMEDLVTFSKGKDYYRRIGKAWKRGYLLYGPPGTGKSTMIAAMANFMDYDVYDLELTSVSDNTELRKLLIETSGKSIILIEDIDCSLQLSGKRKKKVTKKEENDKEEGEVEKKLDKEEESSSRSKVTLSGLLNFIDGLWSSCGDERIIVFTTNHVKKLDPALIRRGRMDMHIELSYCSFEGFKVLAKNYLNIDSHPLFQRICKMIEDTKITPADVAENLLPKSIANVDKKGDTCLENLIQAMKKIKEDLKAIKEVADKKEVKPTRGYFRYFI